MRFADEQAAILTDAGRFRPKTDIRFFINAWKYILSSLEEVWTYREKTAYPKLFGTLSRGIFPLEVEMFERIFNIQDVDPRWLHLGVMEFKPTLTRPSWLYVTSGASTPWQTEPEDYRPEEYSWLGVEFVIEVPSQADWPINALRRLLGYHLLVSHGHFGDLEPLNYGHRVPAGGAVNNSADSKLTYLAIAQPSHYEASVQLASGLFDFLHVTGITEQERDYAKANSTDDLIGKLEMQGAYPVVSCNRFKAGRCASLVNRLASARSRPDR